MEKWSQRFLGAWFGAVAAAAVLAGWQVVTISRLSAHFSLGDLLSNAAVLVVTVASLGLPLLVFTVILDRRRGFHSSEL